MFDSAKRESGGAKQERRANLHFLQLLAENPLLKGLEIDRNVRQFRHLLQGNRQGDRKQKTIWQISTKYDSFSFANSLHSPAIP
jgi:hypothetical protein